MGRLNQPEIPGYRYRSPGQTNAYDLTPNLREDTPASQRADIERIRRGIEAPAQAEHNRRRQRSAGMRAASRTGSRVGLTGAALQGGYEAGRAIDEATGVGRKMVDKAGPLIDRAATGERVKLSEDSKRRIKEEEDFQDMQRALREADEERGYKKGGAVKPRGSGCARKGFGKGTMR